MAHIWPCHVCAKGAYRNRTHPATAGCMRHPGYKKTKLRQYQRPVDVEKTRINGYHCRSRTTSGMEKTAIIEGPSSLRKVRKLRPTRKPTGPPIRVKFWGVRGSIPTPGPATIRYGGNTMCVEVRCGDQILMFDCGTGAREMGLALNREFQGRGVEVHLFISHTHWDHIHGFPFFAPAYTPGSRVTIYSHGEYHKSLKKVFSSQMDARYFPVPLSDLVARLEFVALKSPVQVGTARVSPFHLNHPGIAIGFRVDVGPKSVVYVTDHEAYGRMHGDTARNRKLDDSLDRFVGAADLYIREAQYTEEEYPHRRGWGHSVWKDALDSAQRAGVKSLAIVHHEPSHDDATMDQIMAACRGYMRKHGMEFTCFAAADNQEILL